MANENWSNFPLSSIQPQDLAKYLRFDPKTELHNWAGSGAFGPFHGVTLPNDEVVLPGGYETQDLLHPSMYNYEVGDYGDYEFNEDIGDFMYNDPRRFTSVRDLWNKILNVTDKEDPAAYAEDLASRWVDAAGKPIDIFDLGIGEHGMDTLVDTYAAPQMPIDDFVRMNIQEGTTEEIDSLIKEYEDQSRISNLDYYNTYEKGKTQTARNVPYSSIGEGMINTELVPKPYEGMFKSRLNEPAIRALRYYLGQNDPEPFYDISEFMTPKGPHKDVDTGLLGQFNPDENLMPGVPHPLYADQIGIVDDSITKNKTREDTAWHELLHWYETNYGLPGYMDDLDKYREKKPWRKSQPKDYEPFFNKWRRGHDAHRLIYGLDYGTSSMNPKDQEYKRSFSKNDWDQILKTYDDARKANVNENYEIMRGPDKLDRSSDWPVRSDIDYTYKPSVHNYNYSAPDRGDWGPGLHLNRGGLSSLRR